ncbi:MAG TPA: tetraacyldisaccharide 4'-kinase [Burkholderiaceae bacterium]
MNPGRDWAPALVASWQRPQPDALARVLQPLSWIYGALTAGQRALFASGLRSSARAPRPLIVVGNLLVGGAGKTPTVIALVELLRRLGHAPGVVSRGYGRTDRTTCIVDAASSAALVGDEPLLIHLRARVPVAVAAQRIDAARLLCQAHPDLDVLVADDGLQHLALARDAQVIVFDERGVGNGLLLPAGPLREPLPSKIPERTLVLYNAPRPSTPLPGFVVRRSLGGVVELARWWQGQRADPQSWQGLRGRRVVACAGTAVPQRFFSMLQAQGLDFEPLAMPDHADYRQLPWPDATPDVVVTEKDAVKIRPERLVRTQVWVAPLDFAFDDAVGRALKRWLPPPT